MTSPGRGDLGVIDSEAFDFSQLEDYINDDNENNIYFHEALVTSSDLKLTETTDKPPLYLRNSHHSLPKDSTSVQVPVEATETHGHPSLGIRLSQGAAETSVHSPSTPNVLSQQKSSFSVRNIQNNGVDVTSSFTKPHHLPDSPPDSGSEPPFSPANEDPKLRCPSIDLLHHHHQHHHSHHHLPQSAEMSVHSSGSTEALKHQYLGYGHNLPLKHLTETAISSSTSPTSSSSSPHRPILESPVPVHSTHSISMPVLAPGPANSFAGQFLTQIAPSVLTAFNGNALHQPLLAASNTHLGHLYSGSEEYIYDSLTNPVSSTTNNKKRKLTDSPKSQRNQQSNNGVQVKTEPNVPSPDPTPAGLPSSEDDYGFDLSAAETNAMFVDSSFQCIRFQPFQQNTWAQLLDKDLKEIPSPNFRVDADKGFNFSNADESFVCQKKNHFQVTVHIQPLGVAHFVRTPEGNKLIEKFSLNFHGVKMESPTQTIKVEQSQSDRSKRPFNPVPLELIPEQVTKTTVGRLHFSETTSNNMRKKGKPNPDQRFFFLVVSLCAHVADDVPATIIAHSSEKIIVRASNPGQFENDMELSWQKGHTLDSIFHNGRVGINTDRPEESLVVHGNIKVTGHILQPSDIRAKFGLHELDTKEQLKNVANLRIVRYRYLPEFGDRMGLKQLSDTGVIAQEVQHVLPDAVIEAGDVLLKDGQLIEKLLVVNKERIFMENVGAVKELCKVTDNLENRIGELERINKKLHKIKRKDSLKSTSTDISSRMSSVVSHGKQRCRHTYNKQYPNGHKASCTSHFIQSSIIVLVVIMACCLMALATLYVMEWQNRRHSDFRSSVVFQVKSTSPRSINFTIEDISKFSTLFPIATQSQKISTIFKKPVTDNAKEQKKLSTRSYSPVVTSKPDEETFYGDCASSECPIFCCDPFADLHNEDDILDKQDDAIPHVEMKRSGNNVKVEELKTLSSSLNLTHNLRNDFHESTHSSKGLHNNDASKSSLQKIRKRMIDADDENLNNDESFITDYNTKALLHIVELNTTLTPELCSEKRLDGTSAIYIYCPIYISRHFPHPNVTLQFRTEEDDTVQYCGGSHFISCPREISDDDKALESNRIFKRDIISQSHSWQLPVGSFIRSRYRFRLLSREFVTEQSVCSYDSNYRPFTEYILTFQRKCDK
ncbi:myelin regulatory factor-like protein isoform X2 [Parasteatoda tepidariorum]|uniref:myelin regulatory factor-like protein isoform X2 n=1 Tax=Parasteatoda tepidariorum TaxID=114398 RepID=UPI0039BD2496